MPVKSSYLTVRQYVHSLNASRTFLFAVACLVALLILPETGCNSDLETDDDTILIVNGERVCQAEFFHNMSRLRTKVLSDFTRKYGVPVEGDFWNTRADGVTPNDVLLEETINRVSRIKIQQILMKQYGVIADLSYSAFLGELEAENQRREKALQRGLPIYGPERFTEEVYYEYLFSIRVQELKRILSKGALLVREMEIRDYYNRMRETQYGEESPATYEEVRRQIERELRDAKYETMIDKLSSRAKVEFLGRKMGVANDESSK